VHIIYRGGGYEGERCSYKALKLDSLVVGELMVF